MSEDALFREVDEEVRQDRLKKLWDRHGNAVIGLCIALVAGVAGFKGWQAWQLQKSEAAGRTYFAMATLAGQGKADEALKLIPTIDHAGYAELARLREAGLLLAQGKSEEAVKAYDAIAADASIDPALRDLARIRAAYALADTAKPADLAQRVSGFDQPGNPWRHAAREIAMVADWKAADYPATEKQVQAILGDPETPAGLRQRATIIRDLLLPLLPKT